MATVQVRLDSGGQVVTASITKEAAEELGLTAGQQATVLIKSTDVAIGVQDASS
jgi:molybdopterin-binding protein